MNAIYSAETRKLGVEIPEESFARVFPGIFRSFVREYSGQTDSSDEQDLRMWREITRRVYGNLPGLAPIPFDTWFETLYRRFGEADTWRCYDDVFPVLRDLRRRGILLAIVSNWDSRLRGIAKGLGLLELVDGLYISAEVGRRKPDPLLFERALAGLDVRPEEAIHVGDLPEEDVAGAQRAGVGALLMARDGKPVPDSAVPVIHDLGEIVNHLRTTP